MANLDDYNSKLQHIKSIANEDITTPSIPVDIYLQESEDLYHWAMQDIEQLQRAGISVDFLKDLPIRTGACREAQSIWNNSKSTKDDAEKLWKEKAPAAYDLRDELLHTFRFAYRKYDDILNAVSKIAEGFGHADMLQDLNELAKLGLANQQPLQAINFDINKLNIAAQTSDEMANLLGIVNGDRMVTDESMIIRNKAYTYLKLSVDEIRECGKYVFWKNPDRLKGYKSAYLSRKNKKNNKNNSN